MAAPLNIVSGLKPGNQKPASCMSIGRVLGWSSSEEEPAAAAGGTAATGDAGVDVSAAVFDPTDPFVLAEAKRRAEEEKRRQAELEAAKAGVPVSAVTSAKLEPIGYSCPATPLDRDSALPKDCLVSLEFKDIKDSRDAGNNPISYTAHAFAFNAYEGHEADDKALLAANGTPEQARDRLIKILTESDFENAERHRRVFARFPGETHALIPSGVVEKEYVSTATSLRHAHEILECQRAYCKSCDKESGECIGCAPFQDQRDTESLQMILAPKSAKQLRPKDKAQHILDAVVLNAYIDGANNPSPSDSKASLQFLTTGDHVDGPAYTLAPICYNLPLDGESASRPDSEQEPPPEASVFQGAKAAVPQTRDHVLVAPPKQENRAQRFYSAEATCWRAITPSKLYAEIRLSSSKGHFGNTPTPYVALSTEGDIRKPSTVVKWVLVNYARELRGYIRARKARGDFEGEDVHVMEQDPDGMSPTSFLVHRESLERFCYTMFYYYGCLTHGGVNTDVSVLSMRFTSADGSPLSRTDQDKASATFSAKVVMLVSKLPSGAAITQGVANDIGLHNLFFDVKDKEQALKPIQELHKVVQEISDQCKPDAAAGAVCSPRPHSVHPACIMPAPSPRTPARSLTVAAAPPASSRTASYNDIYRKFAAQSLKDN